MRLSPRRHRRVAQLLGLCQAPVAQLAVPRRQEVARQRTWMLGRERQEVALRLELLGIQLALLRRVDPAALGLWPAPPKVATAA
eukprot:6199815-Pyramimonas_sp.AAC.1